jgi:hypothetical protein
MIGFNWWENLQVKIKMNLTVVMVMKSGLLLFLLVASSAVFASRNLDNQAAFFTETKNHAKVWQPVPYVESKDRVDRRFIPRVIGSQENASKNVGI